MNQYHSEKWNLPVKWERLNKERTKNLYGNALFTARCVKLDSILAGDYDSEPNMLNIGIFYQVDIERLCTLYEEWRNKLATNVTKGANVISDSPDYGKEYEPLDGETYYQQEGLKLREDE